ncbi:thioredoxin domain protein [Gregarina niphandrodes]|uniref:Thioredoxin domain protein n=1 Tax=Gregarina niphandrodes TaxID=110365 RepID=A0A023B714_GRENI|nr:thioredoxin domain protein [Gregarina niphandrodes]EZG66962.1 thioredoxin domain protein [Gregarina niphandrodes]|eukprot:XP_011130399.1 thioredoxin domain protein [Gregarina niphandrodes]
MRTLLWLLVGLFGCVLGLPLELTDVSFDHDTQVGTHGTTGPWFVKFYAPWCGHCRRMETAWNELADALTNEVNVASVDATKNKMLAERFKIAGYPTLIYFKDEKMYRHSGPRTLEALEQFARSDYQKMKAESIPKPLTKLDLIRRNFAHFVQDMEHVYTQRLAAAVAFVFMGLSAGMAIGAACAAFSMKRSRRATEFSDKKKL